jgi:photosystem II stability/assembly factor-like uncharacterized protein
MSRFLTIAAVAALLPLGQRPANPRPIIDWQQVAAPFGGEAEVVLPHGDVLLVRSEAHSLNRWWLSSDHGATWQIAAGQLGEAWWLMPHGADVFIISSGGVHRTSDLGRSWIPCSRVGAHREDQGRLLPAGKSLLYWISNVGLFRSEDRCATWTPVKVPWNLDESGLWAVLAPDAGVLLVHPSHKWFRSTDEGQSWHVVSGPGGAPLPAASGGRPSFAIGTDLVLGTTNGVFRSTDRGLSWSPIGFQGQWTRATTTRDGDIYTALDGKEATARTRIMRSTNGGKTWLPADDGLQGHCIRDLKRDAAGTVYAAGDAGLYRLEATGRWQHVGFATFFPSSLFAAPWGDLYLGADYGDAYRSRDRGVTWQPLLLPAGYKHAGSITATARGDLLMATSTALLRSRDRGDTWEAVQAENLEAEKEILTLFTVRSTGTIAGGRRDGVIRSEDGGQTWTKHSAGASERVVPGTFADRGNGELIVGTADGALYRLPGAKETLWPLPSHGGAAVTSLAVLANGDVLAGTTSGLFRLRPTSGEWDAVSLSREEEQHVTALIVDPRGHLVVATSAGGVLISNDEGRTWWPANQGLAKRPVRRMALGADGELYIATGTDGINYGDSAAGGRLRVYRGRISDQ